MKIKCFLIFLFSLTTNALAQDNSWRGLKIEKENRCSHYNRSKDYAYPQTIENKIVESLKNRIYCPYSGQFFKSIRETDIEHIVSLSEAHDSGLCSADGKTKNSFASDIRNLTLASPTLNRDEKSGHDASGWIPEKNKCWFAQKVIEVKKAYDLTVDSEELVALEKIISKCSSFEIVFLNNNNLSNPLQKTYGQSQEEGDQLNNPSVKKSRSNICHWKLSSPYYFMTKHYQPFHDIQSCLNSGGRCPKRDLKCQNINNKQETTSFQKTETVSYQKKKSSFEQSHTNQGNIGQGDEPNVKKSKSGICHARNSSSSYSRTKNFTAYQSLELCLKSRGRCPKRDFKCQNINNEKEASFQKAETVSYQKEKSHFEQLHANQGNTGQGGEPNVKKSRSGICHARNSSSSYSRTKNFTAYQSLELCLKSGGRCSKRDSACNNMRIPTSH